VSTYRSSVANRRLLTIPFVSVDAYLHYLKAITEALKTCGRNAALVSAAAVSDYYIPFRDRNVHKIQSSSGDLDLHLKPTPKLLPVIRHVYAPDLFYVSFKLETDSSILAYKSINAIASYQMHAVVANELHSRKHHVTVFVPGSMVPTTSSSSAAEDVKQWPMGRSRGSDPDGVQIRLGMTTAAAAEQALATSPSSSSPAASSSPSATAPKKTGSSSSSSSPSPPSDSISSTTYRTIDIRTSTTTSSAAVEIDRPLCEIISHMHDRFIESRGLYLL